MKEREDNMIPRCPICHARLWAWTGTADKVGVKYAYCQVCYAWSRLILKRGKYVRV